MSRLMPILVGLAVLVAAGVVHGLWTERWRPSAERFCGAAGARRRHARPSDPRTR
jgi:hypothetical protein